MRVGVKQLVAAGVLVVIAAVALGGALLAGNSSLGDEPGTRVEIRLPPGSPAAAGRTETITLGGATSARVDVELGAGRLNMTGGTVAGAGRPLGLGQLLRGEFLAADQDPTISYDVDSRVGRLRLVQPEGDGLSWPWRSRDETWNLYLNPTVPTDLRVEVGAGESRLALGGLSLTGLDVATGAGATTLDLSGDWRAGLSGRIEGGAGDLTLRLPRQVGVRVEMNQGMGDLDVGDFVPRDGAYVNPAFGQSPVTIDLTVEHGAGDVALELVG